MKMFKSYHYDKIVHFAPSFEFQISFQWEVVLCCLSEIVVNYQNFTKLSENRKRSVLDIYWFQWKF